MSVFNDDKKNEARKKFESLKSKKISKEELNEAKEKASALGELAKDFLTMVAMVGDTIAGNFKIEIKELAVLIGAIAYVVSPVDAIPDFIPFVGMIDDTFIVGLTLKTCSDVLERYKKKNEKKSIDYK